MNISKTKLEQMTNKISFHGQYPKFKEDFCRQGLSGIYEFNNIDSFMDNLNGYPYNSHKISWDSYYLMENDEGNKCNISFNLMQLWDIGEDEENDI